MFAPPWTAVIPDLTLAPMVDPAFLITLLAVMAIVTAGVFAFLLVRLTRDRHEFWVVRCPGDGRRTLVRIHIAPDGDYEVANCPRFGGGAVTCAQACLREAA